MSLEKQSEFLYDSFELYKLSPLNWSVLYACGFAIAIMMMMISYNFYARIILIFLLAHSLAASYGYFTALMGFRKKWYQ